MDKTPRFNEELGIALFEESGDALFLFDPESDRLLDVNPLATHLSGFSREEMVQTQVGYMFRSTNPDLAERFHKACKSTGPFHSQDGFLLRHKTPGSWLPVNLTVTRLHARPGTVGLITARDISERHATQTALQKTQELLTRLLENLPAPVYVCSLQGRLELVNRAWAEFFHVPREQVLGRPLDEVLPVNLALPFQQANHQVIAGVAPIRFEHGLNVVESDFSLYTIIFPLHDIRGGPEGVAGISLDITERKRAEKQLSEYAQRLQSLSRKVVHVQEEERRHLALELHDEIGQVLTALRINLERMRNPADPGFLQFLQESLGLVDGVIQKVRNLSLDLRPFMLDVQGLEGALAWLLDTQTLRASLTPHLINNLGGRRFAPDLETALFRIAQEALTNVVRHAHARQVWLTLEESEGEIRLLICDDGCGFDVAEARQQGNAGKSFGLLGMQARASLLNGDVTIESGPGGTKIQVRVPVQSMPQ